MKSWGSSLERPDINILFEDRPAAPPLHFAPVKECCYNLTERGQIGCLIHTAVGSCASRSALANYGQSDAQR